MQPTLDPVATDPTPPRGRSAAGLIGAAIAVLVVLLAVAAVLWLSADRRYDDNVAGFARAPSGCDTTLDFERSGTFTLFVETTGELGTLDGDCEAAQTYDRDASDLPAVQLELQPAGGDPLSVEPVDGPSYDTGTYVGVGRARVEVLEPGDHVITVDSDGGPAFAVAVGGDPSDGVALMRWGAGAAAIVSLLAAGALLLVASRRPESTPDPVTAPAPVWPTSPPGFPAPPPTTGAPVLPTPIPGQPPLAGPPPISTPATATPPNATPPLGRPPTRPEGSTGAVDRSPTSDDDHGRSASPWGPPPAT